MLVDFQIPDTEIVWTATLRISRGHRPKTHIRDISSSATFCHRPTDEQTWRYAPLPLYCVSCAFCRMRYWRTGKGETR